MAQGQRGVFPASLPGGEVRMENPDGIGVTDDTGTRNNLYDTGGQHPLQQSGDWQWPQQRYRPSNTGTT